MQIEIKIDSSRTEPKVLILTSEVTEEINQLLKKLSEDTSQIISGSKNGKIKILDQEDFIRIYTGDKKVFAVTTEGEYILRQRLYELEERLDTRWFVRISNSEIINLKKVSHFDFSLTGTICVKLTDNTATYVSRRYVPKIKKLLGI